MRDEITEEFMQCVHYYNHKGYICPHWKEGICLLHEDYPEIFPEKCFVQKVPLFP